MPKLIETVVCHNTGNMSFLNKVGRYFSKYKWLHLMVVPGLLYFILFKYLPMYGLTIAFKNYTGSSGGFWAILDSEWVGFKYFKVFFQSPYFGRIMGNTFIISGYRLLFSFPAPIILALSMNEIRNIHFKRTVQTITYMPYFLSWVVVAGLIMIILRPSDGPVNAIIKKLGGEPIYFLGSKKYFRGILIISEIWKNVGYGTIVYLAAISGIDSQLYEAARVDGANKLRQLWHITLPGIFEIIAIMLILSVGRIFKDNFEQIFNLYSPAVYSVADVFETYIYRNGIIDGKFSYSAAVGFFESIIALMLILVSNWGAKKLGTSGLF